MSVSATGLNALPGTGEQQLHRKDVAEAARQFESLLLTQLLRSAREASGGENWLGSGGDSASSTATEMAEEQFAAALAAQGGLGLARMATASLGRRGEQDAG